VKGGDGDGPLQAAAPYKADGGWDEPGCAPLDLDVQAGATTIPLQHLVQRGDARASVGLAKPGARIEPPELVERPCADRARAIGGAIQRIIMDHHQVSVVAQMHIQLDVLRTHLKRQVIGRQGVLRRIGGGSPMGYGHKGHQRHRLTSTLDRISSGYACWPF